MSEFAQKFSNSLADARVYVALRKPGSLEPRLRNDERVISAVHDVQASRRGHLLPHVFEQIQRTKGVARDLPAISSVETMTS